MRIGLLTNIPTPYRLPLFEMLSAVPGINLSVAFNSATESNRSWETACSVGFRCTVLPGRTVSLRGRDLLSYHINWDVGGWLREKHDVVIVGGYASLAQQRALIESRRLGIPTVLWSGSTHGEPSLARRVTVPLVRYLVSQASAFAAYGSAASAYLQALGAPLGRIAIAPNTVDVDRWVQSDHRQAGCVSPGWRGLDSDRVTILYVGQLIHRKGVDLLLQALATLDQGERPNLVVIGNGRDAQVLKGMARGLGLTAVTFLGSVPYSDLPAFYDAVDAVVLPSRSEVWGLTVNEAMASGKPVVVSDVAGAACDLVRNGVTGWQFSTGSVEDLACALWSCTSAGPKKLRCMGDAARRHVLSTHRLDHTVGGLLKAVALATSTPGRCPIDKRAEA